MDQNEIVVLVVAAGVIGSWIEWGMAIKKALFLWRWHRRAQPQKIDSL